MSPSEERTTIVQVWEDCIRWRRPSEGWALPTDDELLAEYRKRGGTYALGYCKSFFWDRYRARIEAIQHADEADRAAGKRPFDGRITSALLVLLSTAPIDPRDVRRTP